MRSRETMLCGPYIVCALLALQTGGRAPADGPRYVSSHRLVLTFSTGNAAPVEAIYLWLSRDGGKTWQLGAAERAGANSLNYVAPDDGWYGFQVVLRNAAGDSAEPPQSGAEPHVRAIVDTVAPTLQLHGAASGVPVRPGEPVTLRLSLIDEHLGEAGVRVFYRTGESGEWMDGGVARVQGAELTWRAPEDMCGPIDFRVVATDLAGNRATEELCGLPVRLAGDEDASSPPAARAADLPLPAQGEAAAAAPAAEATPRTERQPSAADSPADADLGSLDHLRRLAAGFRAEGRYGLAVARLEDALRASPDNADLLVDLGSTLYWSRQYDEARTRFESALTASPEHVGALEGLALVAATQKRYPQARAHLRDLLRLKPGSAETWLHFGDVEHKLGNKDQAVEAWERVLELDGADETVRRYAEKRLQYFGPAHRRP